MNVALHGLEEAAGVRYLTSGVRAGGLRPGSPAVIRYADDLVALCHSQEQARQIKARLAAWLAPRGLAFNEDKTRITRLDEGFDFLGFSVRRYSGRKLPVKPSKAAVKRLRARLAAEVRSLRGCNALAVVTKLNPIIRGRAACYRSAVSGRVFAALDNYLRQLLYKWSPWSHHDKPESWIAGRYFGKRNKFRNDHWVFGAPGTGAYVVKFAWTDIVRHVMVKGGASPDDPELAGYWAERRRKVKPPLDGCTLRLLARQNALCPLCGDPLLSAGQPPESPGQRERWWLHLARMAISAGNLVHHRRPGSRPAGNHTRLVHASCRRGHRARNAGASSARPRSPRRLA